MEKMTSLYRDADGLRVAMKRCTTKLAAKVLANEYLRATKNTAKLDYPVWLREFLTKEKLPWEH